MSVFVIRSVNAVCVQSLELYIQSVPNLNIQTSWACRRSI